MAKFDDILIEINDFGRYQKVRYFLVCLAGLLPPICTYMNAFIAPNVPYRCDQNDAQLDQCKYEINSTVYKCTSWTYDKKYYHSTLTEEWNMVCDRSYLGSNLYSIYFTGYLVGSLFLGNLADRIGRRPVMLASFCLISIGSIGTAFSPNKKLYGTLVSYIIYATSRFMVACGTRGINETGYVLAAELVSSRKRTKAGIGFEHSFPFGQLILALLAFFIRDWKVLAIIMILPTFPFFAYFFVLPESPRWLLSKNRPDEALMILEKVAKTNKKTLNKATWNAFVNDTQKYQTNNETILTLMNTKIGLAFLSIMCLNWVVNNLVFYGISFKSLDLGVNPYLSFAFSASVELLACTSTFFIIDKMGRKKPYLLFLLTAAVACMSQAFLNNVTVSLTLAMVGKFCVSASYAILRLYSNELFPTSIRNSCMGACSMFSRIGVIIVPLINSLSYSVWRPLPFLIFGGCGLAACLSVYLLPETAKKTLPETIKDLTNNLTPMASYHKTSKLNAEVVDLIQT